MNRRTFLHLLAAGAATSTQTGWGAQSGTNLHSSNLASAERDRLAGKEEERAEKTIRELIEAHRPSRLRQLPPDFKARVGASHVAGTYNFTDQPFLIEGAQRLLELGTKLGKFYFTPANPARDYPFNSQWPKCGTFVDLAQTDYYRQLFALPFSTFILQAHSSVEGGWKQDQPESFYERIREEFSAITRHFYKLHRNRPVTVVLQHWEGDWLLRGRGGELWNPPPPNWKKLCEQMQKWLAARQAGVSRARAAEEKTGAGAVPRCRVVHATEVNRVVDLWKGIPTMTEHVLPGVELDLVSYSSYDALHDPVTLYKCIEEIKKRVRATPLFGKNPVYIGEIGIPENERPQGVAEKWDKLLGAALAAEVQFIVQWELYCNEINPKLKPAPATPVKKSGDVRGFYLVRPDGSLSEAGKYFSGLWKRS